MRPAFFFSVKAISDSPQFGEATQLRRDTTMNAKSIVERPVRDIWTKVSSLAGVGRVKAAISIAKQELTLAWIHGKEFHYVCSPNQIGEIASTN